MEIVALDRVFFGYRQDHPILLDFSLKVSPGENLVVLGESGSGKSTLLYLILGLVQPLSGTVRVFGEIMSGKKERFFYPIRRRIGMVFQQGALFDSMTVAENLLFPLRNRDNLSPEEKLAEVREKLEFVGLGSFMNRYPRELSGGQRKRVAIARALMGNPELILYDEPTTGLDPITAGMILEVIQRIRERYATTAIIVTHELAYAYEIADRVVMVREGRIYYNGGVEEFRRSPDPYLKNYRSMTEELKKS
jgi:phospholipid/cholesterol/gamma-HCH transport system ATP-binding protein